MSRHVFAFDQPDRFVVGTVGLPGERTFYLQATDAGRTVSVVLEKVQVSLLADRLGDLLQEAHERLGATIPNEIAELVDMDPLENPVDTEFRVGSLGLIWDASNDTVVVEASAVGEQDASDDELDLLRVRITPADARAFVERAQQIIRQGVRLAHSAACR